MGAATRWSEWGVLAEKTLQAEQTVFVVATVRADGSATITIISISGYPTRKNSSGSF